MNGSSRREPQSSSSALVRVNGGLAPSPSGSSNMGLIPNVAATLRSLQVQNANALNHAIAQLDTASEIQNELVSARAAYAQVSSDLRKAVDQNLLQANQLQQSKDELHSMNVMLHGAREQMFLLERKLENIGVEAAARERQRTAARDAEKDSQIESLSSALQVANTRISDLNNKLQLVTSALAVVRTTQPAGLNNKTIETSISSLRNLDKQLTSLGNSDQDLSTRTDELAASLLEPATTTSSIPSEHSGSPINQLHNLPLELKEEITQMVKTHFQANTKEKQQVDTSNKKLLCILTSVLPILNVAQASATRNLALEAAFKTISVLEIQPTPPVLDPPAKAESDVTMDEERTQVAEASRRTSMQPTPTVSDVQSPYILSNVTQPPTPSQPVFPLGSVSPRRKRQRTSIEPNIPEPLPRDDELHGLVKLVNITYVIRDGQSGAESGEHPQSGSKQLVCKGCSARHQAQPDFPLTAFDYDQDSQLSVPSLADAEQTRNRIRPWVTHIQEMHQKVYARFMDGLKTQTGARRHSTASAASGH
ncbi:hypothetical protein FRC07_011996 [Ceratobasidium sp. 392]|nr:hypothetical protein FRC07_011996 [Ceratobasidium sp. 392]